MYVLGDALARHEQLILSTPLESQLQSLGFYLNPFKNLEASADPLLADYLVGHDSIAVAWDEAPALIFAPAGGGKTAMRIYTARACWIGLGSYHPFPIPYILDAGMVNKQIDSSEAHVRGIVSAGAAALLGSLAFRPEHFFTLEAPDQQRLVALLDRSLPGSLWRYLELLHERANPQCLADVRLIDRAYILPDLPEPHNVREFCVTLQSMLPSRQAPSTVKADFQELVDLLLNRFKFRSIFLLVDGVDGSPETVADTQIAAAWLQSLFSVLEDWVSQRVFLKGFLPVETKEQFTAATLPFSPMLRQAELVWTPSLLAQLIRARVYVASRGEFGSLDAVSSQKLRDIETMLVKYTLPLPREVIVLVQLVLQAYAERSAGITGQIEPEDIRTAVSWYREQQDRFPPNRISSPHKLDR